MGAIVQARASEVDMAIDTVLEPECGCGELDGPVVLTGAAASGGWVTSQALVLSWPGDLQLAHGRILVLPDLRSVWWPLFATASGVVAAQGAMLSPAATLAREYGLPMVVAVTEALQSIVSG